MVRIEGILKVRARLAQAPEPKPNTNRTKTRVRRRQLRGQEDLHAARLPQAKRKVA